MKVKVSVLMAVYNGEAYLHHALESILNQSYSAFEFMIVDDGSDDDTSSILTNYAAQDDRIILVRNAANIGLARSLNRGLELAQGEYVARMDADDISLPERLAVQTSFLDTHAEIGVLGTAAYLISPKGSVVQCVQYPESHDQLYWTMCFFENPIIHPSVMFRKELVVSLSGYDDTYTTSQDYNLWSRMVTNTKLANLPEVLLHLRKHEGSVSGSRYKQQQKLSLEISASLISALLRITVKPSQIQGYCDFLWNEASMSMIEISFVAGMVFRLAKKFLRNSKMVYSDRLWIMNDAIEKLDDFKKERRLPPILQIKLDYLKWSLKHLS